MRAKWPLVYLIRFNTTLRWNNYFLTQPHNYPEFRFSINNVKYQVSQYHWSHLQQIFVFQMPNCKRICQHARIPLCLNEFYYYPLIFPFIIALDWFTNLRSCPLIIGIKFRKFIIHSDFIVIIITPNFKLFKEYNLTIIQNFIWKIAGLLLK